MKTSNQKLTKNNSLKSAPEEQKKKIPSVSLLDELNEFIISKEFLILSQKLLGRKLTINSKKSNNVLVNYSFQKVLGLNGLSGGGSASIMYTEVGSQVNLSIKIGNRKIMGVYEIKKLKDFQKEFSNIALTLKKEITKLVRGKKIGEIKKEVKRINDFIANSERTSFVFPDDQISNTVYHLIDGLSSSDIKLLKNKTLAHWEYEKAQKLELLDFDSPRHFVYGSLLHLFISNPRGVDKKYYIKPKDLNGVSHKQELALLKMENACKVMVSEDDYNEVKRKAHLVLKNEHLKKIIETSMKEHVFITKNPETGFIKKVKADVVAVATPENIEALEYVCEEDFQIGEIKIIDWKTTKNAEPTAFAKDCANARTDMSNVFYVDVISEAIKGGLFASEFNVKPHVDLVVVEKGEVDIVEFRSIADPDDLEMARKAVNEGIAKFFDKGYKGYSINKVKISMPRFTHTKNEIIENIHELEHNGDGPSVDVA